MEFALQVLFQIFFLEVSRGSFLCERAARFEVDYTQRTACHQKKWCSCTALVQRWCSAGAVQRSEKCTSQERCECTSQEWCECILGTQQRIRASAAPMERPCARKAARHPSAPTSAPTRRQCGARTMQKQVAQ